MASGILATTGSGAITFSKLHWTSALTVNHGASGLLTVSAPNSGTVDITINLQSGTSALTLGAGSIRGSIATTTFNPTITIGTTVVSGQALSITATSGATVVQGTITNTGATVTLTNIQAGAGALNSLTINDGTIAAASNFNAAVVGDVVTIGGSAIIVTGVTIGGLGTLNVNGGATIQGPSASLLSCGTISMFHVLLLLRGAHSTSRGAIVVQMVPRLVVSLLHWERSRFHDSHGQPRCRLHRMPRWY